MLVKCNICGKEFETTDGRRKVCDECKVSNKQYERMLKRQSEYIKERRKTDAEFRKRRYENSNAYRLEVKHKEFQRRAVQLTKFGHDVEALTEYLEENFRLRHK